MKVLYSSPRPGKPSWMYSAVDRILQYIRTNGMSAKRRNWQGPPIPPSQDEMLATRVEDSYRRQIYAQDSAQDTASSSRRLYQMDNPVIFHPPSSPYYHDSRRQPPDPAESRAFDSDLAQQAEINSADISQFHPPTSFDAQQDEINLAVAEVSGHQQSIGHLFNREPSSQTEFYGALRPASYPDRNEGCQTPDPDFPSNSIDGFQEEASMPGGVVDPSGSSTAFPALPSQNLEAIVQQSHPNPAPQDQMQDPMMEMQDPMMEQPMM